ncbi:MAG TPA: efflux RND transporter periplasmic adaptor subunit [Candidatus Cybelea sp.]|nr:efflux RND transporter periplasmic adaptor subunit [Candidatus Cybelea sp.]
MRSAASLALIALLASGCAGARHRRAHGFGSPGPAAVPTAPAAPVTVHPTAQIAGIVAPYQNVSISSSLSEPTDSVAVIEGDIVRHGQVLAVLDTTDLRASLEAAQRSAASDDARVSQTQYQAQLNIGQGSDQVRNARAAVLQAQQTLKLDQVNLQRYQNLLDSGYVSQQQVDQQRTTVHNDQQQVLSAQASLQSAVLNSNVNGNYQQGLQAANVASAQADAASAHAQADQIQAQIDKALVTSPVDGVVVNRNLNPGEYPGSRTIFTVQQLNPVYAELNASSEDVFRIQRGAAVSIAVAGVNTGSYRGRINAVLGQVQPGSTNFTVEAILANPGYRLKSGMAVTGTINLPVVTGIGVPTTAFLDDSHDSIMVVNADGTAKLAKVQERGSDGKTSVVTGIARGTKVVSNGQLGITAGQQVGGQSPAPQSPSP